MPTPPMGFLLSTSKVSMLMSWVRVDSRRMSSPPLLTRDGDRGTGEQWAIFFRAMQALPQPGKVGMWQL